MAVVKTRSGVQLDMAKLALQNETMPAVGNAKLNARGDEIGPDGQIVKTREQLLQEYYSTQSVI
jgi:hypothetical protein